MCRKVCRLDDTHLLLYGEKAKPILMAAARRVQLPNILENRGVAAQDVTSSS